MKDKEERNLYLYFHGRILQHLGIQMYQKPVNAIAELVANSWDAEAEKVDISVPISKYPEKNFVISIKDDGNGMTFEQCQNWFLKVGRDPKKEFKSDETCNKKRPLLGRKGIGKFAGFGIAKKITVDTISVENGEHTIFTMDLDELMGDEYVGKGKKYIEIDKYEEPKEERKILKGTLVTLKGLTIAKGIPVKLFKQSLARRFLLPQMYKDFKITVNNSELPDGFPAYLEYCFPRDYKDNEKYRELTLIDEKGWGEEKLPSGRKIFWRIGFLEDTIKDEELRGVSVFTHGKLSQRPFLFNITGGLSGQHAIEYMTGQVRVDYVDQGETDLIATERQRLNWESNLGKELQDWGQKKIKNLASIWKKRRAEKHSTEIEEKIADFSSRLAKFQPSERQTVKRALHKIAGISTLSRIQLQDLCNAVLTAWELGRLKDLIGRIANSQEVDAETLLSYFTEADVLTALNMAEAIKTKLEAIGELKRRIKHRDLENELRDYLYKKPWLISPRWESYRKETKIKTIVETAAHEYWNEKVFNGRVDLILSSGRSLLVVEFMRPGLDIDKDHLDRFNNYVTAINSALESETALPFRKVDCGYLIADNYKKSLFVEKKIKQLESLGLLVMSWSTLVELSLEQWQDFLDLIKTRTDDERLKDL
jgi:Histidine kinase-, DNA gyrase B-, and HSP90-like ATPase